MRPPIATVSLLFALFGVVGEARADAPKTPRWLVVGHPDSTPTSVSRKFLAAAFLKKRKEWPGGQAIRPVDLDPDSDVRARFSEDVLGRTVAAVKSYWLQVLYSGRGLPPPELARAEDVIEYVLGHPGAVGYICGTCNPGTARTIRVR